MTNITTSAPILLGNRYQLLENLDSGAMGTIYRAQDRLTGQILALKRVQNQPERTNHPTSDSQPQVALAREFQALATLRHPNVISVIDYGFDAESVPFFTMDLLENAQTLLEAGKDLPLAGKVGLLVQVLQALAYVHRRGIVHRDLKPRNILVVGGQVKVLDFGLSVAANDNAQVAGTLPYMPPEILRGEAGSFASDLYAVGVIAYEMMGGQHPFDDQSSNVIRRILTLDPDIERLKLPPALTKLLQHNGGLLRGFGPAGSVRKPIDPRELFASGAVGGPPKRA
jgi:eukaryotic-like serine/threonine-protein kinase